VLQVSFRTVRVVQTCHGNQETASATSQQRDLAISSPAAGHIALATTAVVAVEVCDSRSGLSPLHGEGEGEGEGGELEGQGEDEGGEREGPGEDEDEGEERRRQSKGGDDV